MLRKFLKLDTGDSLFKFVYFSYTQFAEVSGSLFVLGIDKRNKVIYSGGNFCW